MKTAIPQSSSPCGCVDSSRRSAPMPLSSRLRRFEHGSAISRRGCPSTGLRELPPSTLSCFTPRSCTRSSARRSDRCTGSGTPSIIAAVRQANHLRRSNGLGMAWPLPGFPPAFRSGIGSGYGRGVFFVTSRCAVAPAAPRGQRLAASILKPARHRPAREMERSPFMRRTVHPCLLYSLFGQGPLALLAKPRS